MRILIVEDDEPMALIIATMIRSMGRIEIVPALGLALEKMGESPRVDLVLLDLKLVDSTMQLTLNTIRAMKALAGKVVVMTGAYLPDITQQAMSSGADACFYKGDATFVGWLKGALIGPPGSRSPFTPPAVQAP